MSAARDIKGPWLDASIMNRVPGMRREFDLNRDPMIKAQIQDNKKTEAQRRREQVPAQNNASNDAGRGSAMVKQDRPHPAPHPNGPDAQAVDRQAFQERWLAEKRDAVLAQAATGNTERQNTPEPARDVTQEMARASQTPSR